MSFWGSREQSRSSKQHIKRYNNRTHRRNFWFYALVRCLTLGTSPKISNLCPPVQYASQTVPQQWELWDWGTWVALSHHILAKSNSSSRVFEKNTPLWEAWSSLFCLCLPLFFPDLFSPPSGKPKEGGTALLRGALPSQASTPPAKACASEKAVLHHTPATTGHCWAPSLLTRISSELTAL